MDGLSESASAGSLKWNGQGPKTLTNHSVETEERSSVCSSDDKQSLFKLNGYLMKNEHNKLFVSFLAISNNYFSSLKKGYCNEHSGTGT